MERKRLLTLVVPGGSGAASWRPCEAARLSLLPFWKGIPPTEVILAALMQVGCGLLEGQTDVRGRSDEQELVLCVALRRRSRAAAPVVVG